MWKSFKCELGNNQFQFDWCDGHSSPSPPAGCSRKRRHSRVGPHLPPSSATPHTLPSLVRMTSWPPTLACGRWRYKRTLRVSRWAHAAPPTDFFPGSAQPVAWAIHGGYPGSPNVAPRVQLQAVWLGNDAPATRGGLRRRRPHESLTLNLSKKVRLTLTHEGQPTATFLI